jgi:hypothetical protein
VPRLPLNLPPDLVAAIRAGPNARSLPPEPDPEPPRPAPYCHRCNTEDAVPVLFDGKMRCRRCGEPYVVCPACQRITSTSHGGLAVWSARCDYCHAEIDLGRLDDLGLY